MANRFPLTLNTGSSTIEELPSGDNLDLTGSNISNVGNISAGNTISANYVSGTLTTAAQPNITSVGTLSSLTVTGNISGNLITGTLTTSAQPNITSVGTLLNTTMGASNSLTGGNLVSATYLTGTLTTNAQPNITSVGTLTGLTSGGTVNFTSSSNVSLGAVGNVKITGGSANQLLQTDGTGNLSFATVSGDSYMLKPCRVATTTNITLSGTQTIDGVALSVGDRVLVWLQTVAPLTGNIDNGIYIVQSGAWTRATDFTTGANTLLGGVSVGVTAGTLFAGQTFTCQNTGTITIGSTAIIFQRLMNTGLISIWTGGPAHMTPAVGAVNSGALAIGVGANATTDSVAIGYIANVLGQGGVAIGYAATITSTSTSGVALGVNSYANGVNGTAVGYSANTGPRSVSIGTNSGNRSYANTTSIGYNAGIGSRQGTVSIGYTAGQTNQGEWATAIGFQAGLLNQGYDTVAVGEQAGSNAQGNSAVAVGFSAGSNTQGTQSVAIGVVAGQSSQGANSVAIGPFTGQTSQGASSIAIGQFAGRTSQANNTIILNATGANLNQTTANTFTVKPIRNALSGNVLYYDSSTGEITYTNTPLAVTATDVTVNGYSVGTKIIVQNSQSADYTMVASDSGKQIFHPSADTTARTFTIPANSSVPYDIGTTLTIINQSSAGNISIAITTDTMRLAGNGATGTRTLTANGVATAIKVTSTEWIISGVNLT